MKKHAIRLLAALSLLGLAACETKEVVELRAILAEREQELVRKRYMADELNVARRDLDVLQKKLPPVAARESVSMSGVTPAKLLAALRAWPETAAYSVGSFEVGAEGNSQATLEPIRLPQPAAPEVSPRPLPARKPLPEPSILSWSEGRKLREQIFKTEGAIAALDRIVAEMDKISQEFGRLRVQLQALEALSWGRLGAEPGLVDKLFGEPNPLLRSGKFEAVPGGFKVTGKLSPGVAIEALRAVVPAGLGVSRLAEQQSGVVTLEATKP
ncbi:MAG TPA: hypothetical protein VGK67_31595 [Myxococcales bacterium]|jgi:hypothetical protein